MGTLSVLVIPADVNEPMRIEHLDGDGDIGYALAGLVEGTWDLHSIDQEGMIVNSFAEDKGLPLNPRATHVFSGLCDLILHEPGNLVFAGSVVLVSLDWDGEIGPVFDELLDDVMSLTDGADILGYAA